MAEDRVKFKDLDDDEKIERITKLKEQAADARKKHRTSTRGYYSWGETINDIKNANGAGETAIAGAKWAGKSLFNIGKFTTGELLPAVSERSAKLMEESMKNKK